MKHILTLALTATLLTLGATSASARDRCPPPRNYIFISGYTSCGTPIYKERYFVGYDGKGRPRFRTRYARPPHPHHVVRVPARPAVVRVPARPCRPPVKPVRFRR